MKRFSSWIFGVGLISLLLIFPSSTFGYSTNMSASVAVGQLNFSSTDSGLSASQYAGPWSAATDGEKLFVVDSSNRRVLIYNSIPKSNGGVANVVLGQPDFTTNTANYGGLSASSMSDPRTVVVKNGKVFVSDGASTNRRILIWNSIPTQNNTPADVVVCQTSFTTAVSTVSQNTCTVGEGSVATDGNKFIVADYDAHRILIWNTIPTTNGAPADVVLGQISFTSSASNDANGDGVAEDGISAQTLKNPHDVAFDGQRLFVVDRNNNRVLIWNSLPTQNRQAADVVVGQQNMTVGAANDSNGDGVTDSRSASTLSLLRGVYSDGTRLYIADDGNDRILIWNSIPTTNGQPADIVIGQDSFTGYACPHGDGAKDVCALKRLTVYKNQLFVAQSTYRRILIFDNIVNTPQISLEEPVGSTNDRLRIKGNINVSDGLYDVWKLEAAVNGGDYSSVSNLTTNTFYPGKTNPASATFYHDFEPWSVDNGKKEDWIASQSAMIKDRGYTVKFRGYNTNADKQKNVFYFQPFNLSSPQAISTKPIVSFSVNKYQRTELKNNLDHYEVWVQKCQMLNDKCQINKDNWEKYIDKIPIDYDLVKEYTDNLRRGEYVKDPGTGNGTYENEDLVVTYTNSSSNISVRKKGIQENTIDKLTPGTYQLKLTAVDKAHHTQDSEPIIVTVRGSPNNKNNLALTKEWFPLQINTISGAQTGILSSFKETEIKPSYNISTTSPIIKGIAFTNTQITMTITDTETGNQRTYTTYAKDSKWILTPKLYTNSLIDLSTESTDGKYTELPAFTLNFIPTQQ